MRLHGKLAVISGASRGIGKSIARLLAHHGASTILLGRESRTLEATRNSLASVVGQSHGSHQIDVSKPNDWDNLIKEIPTPDILINAAGKLSIVYRAITDMD